MQGETAFGPNIIHYRITGAHPAFARTVLKDKVYHLVTAQGTDVHDSIAPREEEIGDFRVHPMVGNAYIYMDVLVRTGQFLAGALKDLERTREVIMYYQIYLDPVIVTSVEHTLWTCSLVVLKKAAVIAGFPIGDDLVRIKAERGFSTHIDRYSVVKAMVESADMINCLPTVPAAEFLLSVKNPAGSSDWIDTLV